MNALWKTLTSLVAIVACLAAIAPTAYGQCPPSFAPAVNYDVGSHPYFSAIGDLNGDGRLDLAIANSATSNVSVLLGNGNGTFGAAANYASGNWPQHVAIGDLNGDGRPDLVTANNLGHSVSVLLGNGDGTFQLATGYPSGGDNECVAIGDLDDDGRLDLVAASYHTSIYSVFMGNGDGTFQPAVDVGLGDGAGKAILGDFNGDGRLDLAIVQSFTGQVAVMLGNGDGTFGAIVAYPACPPRSAGLATGDLNGDGRLDLVATNFGCDNASILLGNGDGTFQTPVHYVVGGYPWNVAIGDLNGDGLPDLAVTSETNNYVSVLLGNGDGTFDAANNFDAGIGTTSVAIGDVDADGLLDLVTANWGSNNASVLLNTTPCGEQAGGPATVALHGPTACIIGNQLVVSIDLSCPPEVIAGGQYFLTYDNTVLDFVSADPGDAPFTREIYEAVNETLGTIDYAVGTPDGGTGTCADTAMSRLTFTILQNVCTPTSNLVTWRTSGPNGAISKLSDDNGNEVQIDPVNLGGIKIDNTPPSITCPSNITVNADPGGCSAVVAFTLPTATDNCDPNPMVTAVPPSGSTFPSGPTTVTLTATDSCGNSSTCLFTVTVNPVNEVVATVQLGGGVVVAGPFTRAITFELWNTTVNPLAPLHTVCQAITFTNGLSSPVTLTVPCQAAGYTCITARDRLHTLRRTITPLPTVGVQYVADFTVAKALIGGNMNDDQFIDILDFGVFSWKWATNYGSGSTTCSTTYPHADVNGNGLVDTADYTFIQINFLQCSEANCAGLFCFAGVDNQAGPITSIAVRELRQRGLQHLAAGDLDGDGVLNQADIAAFLLGDRPKPPRRSALQKDE